MNHAPTRPAAYQTLDAWRGFASIWVALFHAASTVSLGQPALSSQPVFVLCSLGFLGVPLFFVVSGFCIAGSALSAAGREEGFGSFLQARFRRIYPPCWFSLIFYAAFSLLAGALVRLGYLRESTVAGKDLLHQGPLYYLANLTLTQIPLRQPFLSIVCWTLCYEVAFYLIVGLLLWGAPGRNKASLLNLLHLVTFCALGALILAPGYRFYPLDLWPQFGFGVLVYDLIRHPGQARPRAWSLIIGLQTIAFVLLRSVGLGYMLQPSRLSFAVSLGFALLLVCLYRRDAALSRIPPVRWLSWVGRFSYSLYLTHYLCIGAVNQILRGLPGVHGHPYAALVVSVLAALGVAWLFYQCFERPFSQPARRAVPGLVPSP